MTGEVTFLRIFFPFQTHILNVEAHSEINRTCSLAELATLRKHSYSQCCMNYFLHLLWKLLVFSSLPLFGGIDNLCTGRIQNGNCQRPAARQNRVCRCRQCMLGFDCCPGISQLMIKVRAWHSALQVYQKFHIPSQLGFSKSPLSRVNPTLKKDRRSCWGKLRYGRCSDL